MEDCEYWDNKLCDFVVYVQNVKYCVALLKDCCTFNDSIETVHTGCYSYYYQSVFNSLSLPHASMWYKLKWNMSSLCACDASSSSFIPSIRLLERHSFPFNLVVHLPLNVLYPALSAHTHTCATFYIHYIRIKNIFQNIQCTHKNIYKLNEDWIFTMWMLPRMSCRCALSVAVYAHIKRKLWMTKKAIVSY